ncbi:MAG: BMP family protein [Thermoanaerobacter sp.]|nr:BMP family protein [Thermoanaerobacter sp.]
MLRSAKKLTIFLVIITMVLNMTSCKSKMQTSTGLGGNTGSKEKVYKVAILLPGSVNDGGWSASAYEGLVKIEKELGCKTAFTENVKKNDQVQIMREYAKKGFDIIIGHGFEFSDALKQVSQEYPNIKFVGIGTMVTGPNLASLQFKYGELGYLTGFIAAKSTHTNKIGIITATKDPTGQIEFDTLEAIAKQVNPNVAVAISYTGSWEDIYKAKEAAIAQIGNGADVIITNNDAGNLGVIQAAKEKGVFVIGWTGDYYKHAPDNVLTSAVQKVSLLIFEGVKGFLEKGFEGKVYQLGLKEGVQYIGEYGNTVPQELKDEVKKITKDIIEGKINIEEIYKVKK